MSYSITKIFLTVVTRSAAFALTVLSAATAAHAQTTEGACAPAGVKYIANGGSLSTSTSFSNVDGAATTIVQGGNAPSCVLVLFSGAAASDPSTTMFLRATLDGHTIAVPSQLQFFRNSTTNTLFFESRAGNFVFPSVAPGTHRVRIQFMSGDGGFVQFTNTTLIVHYAK